MLPLNPATLPQRLAEASALERAGRPDEAERALRAILSLQPASPQASFHLGRLLAARKDPEALDLLSHAARLVPHEAAIWLAWAAAARALQPGHGARVLAAAEAARLPASLRTRLRQMLTDAPAKPVARPGLGRAKPGDAKALVDAFNAGRLDEAERRARTILRGAPDSALVLDVLGSVRMAAGDPAAALEAFRRAVACEPGWGDGHLHLAQALLRLDRPAEALDPLARAAALSPRPARALTLLARVQIRLGRLAPALAALTAAVEADPRQPEAQAELGLLHARLRNHAEAAQAFRAAEAAGDRSALLQMRLGQALLSTGDEAGATACLDRALTLEPENAIILSRKALLLQGQGDFAAAEALLRRAIALSPGTGEFYRLLSAGLKLAADDPLLAQMQRHHDDPATSEADRMHLGFALAKAMEDLKRHDRVFAYLRPANERMRKLYPYDIATRRAEVEAIRAAFADFAPKPAEGRSDFAPVFVTGMPRSGTTLVEQIIASHSRMTGAGEAAVASREAHRLMADPSGGFRPWGAVAADEVAALGHRYAAEMRRRFPQAIRVVDKSIQTYAWLGLLAEALPEARFVLVRRDPRDVALSIYRNVFPEHTHLYAYDLRDIARYFRLFEELVAFWRARMPGRLHEIRYEDLVARPEEETRRLIAACGLDWEDACLKFHENGGSVQTLSLYQVRQPIYRSSAAAWERHADELQPFIEAWEAADA